MTKNFIYPRNAFLGFDHIFDQLENIHSHAKDTYPPYNVVKHDNLTYEIEMAVAGFKKDHIDIEVKDHVMTIIGDRPNVLALSMISFNLSFGTICAPIDTSPLSVDVIS